MVWLWKIEVGHYFLLSLLWLGGGFNFVQDIQMCILQSTPTWGDDPIWQVCLGRGSLWMQPAKWVCLNLVCSGKFLPERELCVSNHPTRFIVILRRFAPICLFACFTPNSDTTSEEKGYPTSYDSYEKDPALPHRILMRWHVVCYESFVCFGLF